MFVSKRFAEFMAWGHSFMYRHIPGLFRWGYSCSKNHPMAFKQIFSRILVGGSETMYEYLLKNKFDTVICTQSFATIILTHMLKNHPISIRTAFVATDYTCYPGMEDVDVQKYFIPSKCLMGNFEKCGIQRERITAAGIPVCRSFFKNIEKEDAKRLLNLNAKNKHLLIMCGSMGCGPITKMVKELAKKMPENVEVSVICGTNQRLKRRLEHRYKKNERIHIVGYTNQISLYMDSADLYLTKPGGISVTEAAVKKLPMVLIKAVAGCEEYNMDYFAKIGAAITANSVESLIEKSLKLLSSEQDWLQMKNALNKYRYPDGAEVIYHSLAGGKTV